MTSLFRRLMAVSVLLAGPSGFAGDDRGLCASDPKAAIQVLKDRNVPALDGGDVLWLVQDLAKLGAAELEKRVTDGAATQADPAARARREARPKMVAAAVSAVEELKSESASIADAGLQKILATGVLDAMLSGLRASGALTDAIVAYPAADAKTRAKILGELRRRVDEHKGLAFKAVLKLKLLQNSGLSEDAKKETQRILDGLVRRAEVSTCVNSYRAL